MINIFKKLHINSVGYKLYPHIFKYMRAHSRVVKTFRLHRKDPQFDPECAHGYLYI